MIPIFNGILGQRLIYGIWPIALIVSISHRFFNQGPLAIATFLFIVVVYSAIIWLPETGHHGIFYTMATFLLIVVTLCFHFLQGNSFDSTLLWPLIFLLAAAPSKYNKLSIILATLVILVIVFIHINPFPWMTILTLIGIYMGIHSRKIRKEANQISKLHLQELEDAHLKLQQAHAELQETTVQSMHYAALSERTRLAREIHDGLGHHLTSLIVQLQALQFMMPNEPEESARVVQETLSIARKGMAEVRLSVREWSEDETGLGLVALKGLVSQTEAHSNLKVKFLQVGDISDWSTEISVILYRVLQESLTNIMRHARATSVVINVEEIEDQVELTVSDNGEYTGIRSLNPGFGIKGIMERCQSVGGVCTFSVSPPHGLQLKVLIPITLRKENEIIERMNP